jgi:hypothetical protein
MPLSSGNNSTLSPAQPPTSPFSPIGPVGPLTTPQGPPTGLLGSTQPAQFNANPYAQWVQSLVYGQGGTLAEQALTNRSLQQQITGTQGGAGIQEQALQQQTGTSLAQNQLAGANIGLQEQGNTLAAQLATALQGINTQQYGLTKQGLQQQEAQNIYGYQTGLQNQLAAGAASGASGSKGQQQALTTLKKGEQWTTKDIQRQLAQAKLGYQAQTQQYLYGQQQTALQQRTLANLAKSNNLSAEQLTNQLKTGLDQLRLTGVIGVEQLRSQIGQALATNDTNLLSALTPIFLASGLNVGHAAGAKK